MVDSTNLPDVDINQIVTDLNGKMDRDCLNASDTGKIQMASMGMPSDKYIDLTLNASGSTYTAPADGYICLGLRAGSSFMWCQIYGAQARTGSTCYGGVMSECYLPVKKNEIFIIGYGGDVSIGGAGQYLKFVYAVGSESEAQ